MAGSDKATLGPGQNSCMEGGIVWLLLNIRGTLCLAESHEIVDQRGSMGFGFELRKSCFQITTVV